MCKKSGSKKSLSKARSHKTKRRATFGSARGVKRGGFR